MDPCRIPAPHRVGPEVPGKENPSQLADCKQQPPSLISHGRRGIDSWVVPMTWLISQGYKKKEKDYKSGLRKSGEATCGWSCENGCETSRHV